MEAKVCKICGRELPEAEFQLCKGGGRVNTCKECRTAAIRANKASRRKWGGIPFSDPDFDGMTPSDVWRQMCRAKKWLESRGYVIQLDGEYREVKIRKLKIE